VGHIRLQDGNVGAFPEEAAVVLAADGGRVVDLYSGRRSPASAGRFFFMAFPFTRGRATRADETRAAASLNVAARFELPTFWFVAVNSLLILRNYVTYEPKNAPLTLQMYLTYPSSNLDWKAVLIPRPC
jgi:hypothetical protein